MTTPNQRYSQEEWEHTCEEVDLKIAQLALICRIRLLDPGVIERVLDNDTSLCHSDHEHTFEQLRGMVFLHYEVQGRLLAELGPADGIEVINRVRQHLLGRIGTRLGTLGSQ